MNFEDMSPKARLGAMDALEDKLGEAITAASDRAIKFVAEQTGMPTGDVSAVYNKVMFDLGAIGMGANLEVPFETALAAAREAYCTFMDACRPQLTKDAVREMLEDALGFATTAKS